MNTLQGKKIILGITGSIAAYKSAVLTRLLVKKGAEIKVMMTPAAKDFITPLTLATLSKHPVLSEFISNEKGQWNNHVELGLWADLLLIAPASANTLAKMAHGMCDNLLLATYLSARCPVYFAPAMDLDMYKHPATVKNIALLQSFGHQLIQPGNGELASGLHGEGRMAEPEEIVDYLEQLHSTTQSLAGKKALVTAGPTYEAIDPVRFIGNHSSGKMGFAIAEELAAKGADVTLISGPGNLLTRHSSINRVDVISANEMYQEAVSRFPEMDIAVMSAAVADYTPLNVSAKKIKKQAGEAPVIELTHTKDILKEMGKLKKKNQVLVGFALETDDELENAKKKLKEKNLNFIVLNSLKDEGAGFRSDTNKITTVDKNEEVTQFELKQKDQVAKDIVGMIIEKVNRL